MNEFPHLAISAGEPAGIGPDLCLLLSRQDLPCRLTILADPQILRERAETLGLTVSLHEGAAQGPQQSGHLNILPHPVSSPVSPGRLDPNNAHHVLSLIETAVQGCLQNRFDALVTAPVHKGVINDAGIPFSGHTEFIAELTGGQAVMMLSTGNRQGQALPSNQPGQDTRPDPTPLRVALVTTHLPLGKVPEVITRHHLDTTLKILHQDLQSRFALPHPRITVLGLNPHAGEGGHLGHEEVEIIGPLLEHLRHQGMDLTGPLPADTAFLPHILSRTDVYLAMYHDQGLPVLKFAGFGRAVNITLGLPIIRTSVDHGTALELAGSGQIDCGSLLEAIATAMELTDHVHNP